MVAHGLLDQYLYFKIGALGLPIGDALLDERVGFHRMPVTPDLAGNGRGVLGGCRAWGRGGAWGGWGRVGCRTVRLQSCQQLVGDAERGCGKLACHGYGAPKCGKMQ